MLEQIVDGNRQIVVRVHQTRRRDDTVTVVVRVVGEREVKLVAQRQQARHCALGGAVHTDGAIFVEMHKAESLVNLVVNNGQVQVVVFTDTFPVFDTGTAQRIDAQRQARFLDSRHIDDIRQPFDEGLYQIPLFHMAGRQRGIQRNTFHAFQSIGQQRIGAIFHHFGDVSIGRATVRRIVFDTTVFRRVVRRRNHDTVCQWATFFVVNQNGV